MAIYYIHRFSVLRAFPGTSFLSAEVQKQYKRAGALPGIPVYQEFFGRIF